MPEGDANAGLQTGASVGDHDGGRSAGSDGAGLTSRASRRSSDWAEPAGEAGEGMMLASWPCVTFYDWLISTTIQAITSAISNSAPARKAVMSHRSCRRFNAALRPM
jgi:hypothetical protein